MVAAISTLLIAVTVVIVLVVGRVAGLLVFVRAEAPAPARMAGP